MSSKPTIYVQFEHKIRQETLVIDAMAWHDYEGIYKVALDRAWLGDECVNGLLTDDDIADIESAIEPAIRAENEDDRISTFDPARDAFRLGD